MNVVWLRAAALLLSLVCAQAGFGQSLSIKKDQENQLWLEARGEGATRYAVQVSKDLNLWLDIDDAVFGAFSERVGNAALPERYFRLVPWVEPPQIRIVLLGDSSVADLEANFGHFYGWGQGMYGYFKSSAQIINLAYPGMGTKGFLASEQKTRMLAIKPDYVLITLCYVDVFNGPDEVRSTPEEYEQNLRIIIQMVRDFNGTPILVLPQALWIFNVSDQTGVLYPERNEVMKKLSAELQVHLVDLSTPTIELLNRLGKSGSQYLFADWLHFTATGADVVSGFVVDRLPPNLGCYLVTEKILPF
jgi:lysophospholipase L1-like esterase